ncbi:hypothetical protein mRhiFer1_008893 [Rhinolophus ferrumequinum]|uniref:Uncharacterized protein n=1 Tax=Rhinolophus ferrumequinum TaxID=59479 RepID=A0A7J7TDT6_RHIFE|nr:hypothetical protein mRhiFer1_008893 [Rhinolophus ferrumequinum]
MGLEMWVLGTLVTMVTPPFIRLAAADVDSCSPFPLTSSLLVSTEPPPPTAAQGLTPSICAQIPSCTVAGTSRCAHALSPPGIPKRTGAPPSCLQRAIVRGREASGPPRAGSWRPGRTLWQEVGSAARFPPRLGASSSWHSLKKGWVVGPRGANEPAQGLGLFPPSLGPPPSPFTHSSPSLSTDSFMKLQQLHELVLSPSAACGIR